MVAFKPSLKAWCSGLLQFATIGLLVESCLAKDINIHSDNDNGHGVHEANVNTIQSSSEPSIYVSIFKRGNGRVVTSTGTSYIDITIPCTASEIPSSMSSLIPTETSQSLSTSATDLSTDGSSIVTASSTNTVAPSSTTTTQSTGASSVDKATKTIIISGIVTETSYYSVPPTGGGTLTVTVRDGTKTVTASPTSVATSSSSKKGGPVVWVTATAKQTVTEWWDTTTSTPIASSSSKTGGAVVVVTQTASAVVTKVHDTWETIWVSDSPAANPTPAAAPNALPPHNLLRRGITTTNNTTTHPANSSIQATSRGRVVRIRETVFYNEKQHMASVAVYDIGIGGDERSVVTGHVYDQGGPKDLPSDLTLSDPSGASLRIDFAYGFFTISFESSKGGGRVQSWSNWQDREGGAPGWCENVDYGFESGIMTRAVNCWYTP